MNSIIEVEFDPGCTCQASVTMANGRFAVSYLDREAVDYVPHLEHEDYFRDFVRGTEDTLLSTSQVGHTLYHKIDIYLEL